MKQLILAALLAAALMVDARAQESGKTVAVEAGPPPSSDYVWVTINGTTGFNLDSVMIRNTDSTAVMDATGNPVRLTGALTYGFTQPYDIVGSRVHRRVFVSNQGNGTVSVVDSDSLQPIGIVTLAGCTTARGMSLSEDESTIFVAGGNAAGPAVWRISTTTLATDTQPIGAFGDVTHIAEDCVVIRAGNAGGSGNGPGKLYFSVQTSGTLAPAPGYIGIVNLMTLPASPPFPAPASIGTQVLPLASVNLPTNMERTPDHRFVFVCCNKVPSFGADLRIIRINPLTDVASAQVVDNVGITDTNQNRILEVSWTTTSGGANRGIVLAFHTSGAGGGLFTREIDDTGQFVAGTAQPGNSGGLTTPLTVRFARNNPLMFVGDDVGTNNGYARYDTTPSPPALGAPIIIGVGSRCLNFAVMPTPAVVISDITPRAGPDSAGTAATVRGAGFQLGLTALAGATPVPITVIDSTTATVNFTGLVPGTYGLTIRSPNMQAGGFGNFYRNFAPPGIRPLPTDPAAQVALPSAGQGYRLCSFPQYATLTALKAAFTAQLGPYNPVLYRVFFYRQGGYVELNQLPDDGCDLAGEAFWVLTRNGATLTLTEPDVRQNNGGTDRVIPISPGFNLVSLPTLNGAGTSGTIAWANMHVTADETNFTIGSPGGPVNVTSAAGLLLVEQAIEFVNGGYVLATDLVAGQGCWVRNLSTGPAYLVFSEALITKPGVFKPSFAAGVPPPAGSMPPPPPAGMASSSRSGGCGLLGLEWLLLALLRAVLPRRRLSA